MLNAVILLVFYFAMSIIVPTFATSKRNKLIITKKKKLWKQLNLHLSN